MTKHKKTASVIFLLLFIITILLGLLVVNFEYEHNCIGENCPICSLIIFYKSMQKSLLFFYSLFLEIFCMVLAKSNKLEFVLQQFITPVSLKVKLLN